jgi:PIN domain nuclease of toxin-antitoxin system
VPVRTSGGRRSGARDDVTALDAYALVAFLADEPARPEVADILRGSCVMSTVNLAESLDVLGRVHGIEETEIRALVDPLLADTVEVDAPSAKDAWAAASLRREHYRRSARDVSLADCFLLAVASRLRVPLATADPAVAAVARDMSIELVALPDRSGARP